LNARKLVTASVIGALYAALTLLLAPISFGAIQLRVSEALMVLPFFMPHAAWGLAVGCAISNLVGGFGLPDIIFGSLATLAAGLIAAKIRKRPLVPLPAVLINAVVVGAIIAWYTTGFTDAFPAMFAWNALTVGLGQIGACYVIGLPLLYYLPKIPVFAAIIEENGHPDRVRKKEQRKNRNEKDPWERKTN